jgi:hypothetical protein
MARKDRVGNPNQTRKTQFVILLKDGSLVFGSVRLARAQRLARTLGGASRITRGRKDYPLSGPSHAIR